MPSSKRYEDSSLIYHLPFNHLPLAMAVADFSPFHLFTFSLLLGWLLDLLLGDPSWLPHPVVGFGKVIAFGERHLNKGSHRKLKGALLAVSLIAGVFVLTWLVQRLFFTFHFSLFTLFNALIIFYCLAGTTLIREVREVFLALGASMKAGSKCHALLGATPLSFRLRRFARRHSRLWLRTSPMASSPRSSGSCCWGRLACWRTRW